jgi:8-oxo-dGTP pyrophosphatase MutT (NUDIX family)
VWAEQGPSVEPFPSATIVLMRDGANGLEILLLRRSSRAGFAPGAFVFPGGRLDEGDATADAVRCVDGLTPERAAARLGLPEADPPAIAYYVAAVREAFEETGILVAVRSDGTAPATAADDARTEVVRNDLLECRIGIADALARLECRIAGAELEYLAHWITPERSPRRFDTRFFAARVGSDLDPIVDVREMTEARWITPAAALLATREGTLPMILPTVRTLERLATFGHTRQALAALADAPVPTILPAP